MRTCTRAIGVSGNGNGSGSTQCRQYDFDMRLKPSPSRRLIVKIVGLLEKHSDSAYTTLPLHVNCYVHLNVDFSFILLHHTYTHSHIHAAKLVPMTVDLCQLMKCGVVVYVHVINKYCVENSSYIAKSSKMLTHDLEVSTNHCYYGIRTRKKLYILIIIISTDI